MNVGNISKILLFLPAFMLWAAGAGFQTVQAQQMLMSSIAQAEHTGVSVNDPYRSEFFRVRGIPSITVHTLEGEIEVVKNPSLNGVQIDLYVQQSFSLWSRAGNLDNYRMIFQQRGDQIIASVEDKRSGRRAHGDGNTRFTFVVQVPAEKASLNLRTINGDIHVNGITGTHFIQNHTGSLNLIQVQGEVRASSTMGDISVNDSKGILYAKSVSGSLFIDHAEGEVRLRSVSGNIDTKNLSGVLVAASTSGNIYSEFIRVSKGIHLETISGNVDVFIPEGPGYAISAAGMGFDFNRLNLAGAEQYIRAGNASVILGDGDIPVNIKTTSGRVTIRENK